MRKYFRRSSETGTENTDSKRVTREDVVRLEKERFLSMKVEEKRKLYKCGSKYLQLDDIPTWSEYYENHISKIDKVSKKKHRSDINPELNGKVSIWRGDITCLEIDAIANAANSSLLGGGGVDGAIHSAAGSSLRAECATLHGCETGDAKITAGYKLPAKYIIHTVGPIGEHEHELQSCYSNCVRLLKKNELRSLALPCISTGIYGYPNEHTCQVALMTTRKWLEQKDVATQVDRIIFCLFLPKDVSLYEKYLQIYFPISKDGSDEETEETSQENEENEDAREDAANVDKEKTEAANVESEGDEKK